MSKYRIDFAVILLFVCGAGYATGVAADEPPSYSNIVFSKGYNATIGSPANQDYLVSNHDHCDLKKATAAFGWFTGNRKTVSVDPGDKIVVTARTLYFYSSSVGMINGSAVANVDTMGCKSTASFVPERGHNYAVKQIAPFAGMCVIEVMDMATNAAPASFTTIPDGACEAYFKDGDTMPAGPPAKSEPSGPLP